MDRHDSQQFSEPDIKLAGFCLWVHGRQFEEAQDYWDGNWLRVTAHYGAGHSQVWAQGSILHLSELAIWFSELEKLHRIVEGSARLRCIEPNLRVEIKLGRTGSGEARFEITPEYTKEGHWFLEKVDQSYFPDLIRDFRRLLEQYPVRGKPKG